MPKMIFYASYLCSEEIIVIIYGRDIVGFIFYCKQFYSMCKFYQCSFQIKNIYRKSIFNVKQAMKETRKSWTHEEDEVLKSLIKKHGGKRWTLISEKINQKFPDEGRSGKQCRQRWCNHLNPEINKTNWTQQQLSVLFDAHKKYGNRWRQICKVLPGRTDNAIKNQFYCTLRKSLRRIYRILGTNNSTVRIKKIRPTTLSLMIAHYHQQYESHPELKDLDIYQIFSQYANDQKFEEIKQNQVSQETKERLEKILNVLLQYKQFNKRRVSRFRSQHPNKGKLRHTSKVQPKVEQMKKIEEMQEEDGILNEGEIKSLSKHSQGNDLNWLQLQGIQNFGDNPQQLSHHNLRRFSSIMNSNYKGLENILEAEYFPPEKPFSIKKQNSQNQAKKLVKKQSGLSSEKNLFRLNSDRQNLQNFFPFEDPVEFLPSMIAKPSNEEYNCRLMMMEHPDSENKPALQADFGKKTRKPQKPIKKKTFLKDAVPEKNKQANIDNIFQGFSRF